ncbi:MULTISPECIES: NtaA/DmoA family FMN-dependent monooxygenase [Microbacterium]|uniref:NtaA/DmoA family FMN-dependent monooxygenase n=1 Tax=Microbacterium TaxID=33882 RepID=UPI0006F3D80D|nr:MULTISPECIES: NtaA/DmoA family FMN-dependent monooxygenase [unclassified Microbacterium]MBN9199155.1 NtaA/DmoA family FMN-dependent monooxygenase [Microbacterium ginsengisoli]MCK9917407.1 NtaA/DmoA family FMN-dependent monooxygenase [Microbacteriaceae bacterium K1510]KQR99262.1 F420-dependent methylene-tetrahydromethanopterin reductase [Microbacterium sp. Leaf347]KQS02569.1 F420-dependent methylene-tetrahydromethanopterin reductase [Microbacterium sp. Leaf351]OJU74931.1 MAG: F420-dependent 
MTAEPRRQIHLAAHFPGVNATTVWSDPLHRSQIEFSAFEHFARTAERGRFDYLFLAEGLRLREQKGVIHEYDVAGRPATLAVLAALAAVTEHIGLVGTLSATFNEPYELARQLATLDLVSDGRAGWNVVTTNDAFHGANFRRGAFLDHADRYVRAAEFIDLASQLWRAWPQGADAPQPVAFHGSQFDVQALPTLPGSRQGRPLIVQAGDSDEGRQFAAENADVIFSRHTGFDEARAFYDDVKRRLGPLGRAEDDLKILPAATVILGDTAEEAAERARVVSRAQITPPTAIAFLEQVWGTDLSGLDPDGPLPAFDPDPESTVFAGRVRFVADPVATAREWRALAEAENLSARDLAVRFLGRQSFVGTPETVADAIDHAVQQRATDGFVVVGTTSPHGLDEFVERVIPLLQDRGSYRSEYPERATLRELLDVGA